jgi:spermidine synthase
LLYGINTLGGVVGAFAGTFLMLELFGTRRTLWLACLANLLVALAARQLARGLPLQQEDLGEDEAGSEPSAPIGFVLAASGVVGFAFFLMELVWYRMLAPILGGSIFTFGLILAVALLGIGLGGWVYSRSRRDAPVTLSGFATTCLFEAACLALPYALGDRIAVLATLLHAFGPIGLFWGQVACWALICAIVVLPAALVAGYQFPMLVALLGRGRRALGRQVGQAYACNTLGAIVGSLAGGFGLIPYLSAPGAWRFAALVLVALGLAAALLARPRGAALRRAAGQAGLAVAIVIMLASSLGPTAAWRHSGIGAGRAPSGFAGLNPLEDWLRLHRATVVWEADGVESSVALVQGVKGVAFIINGKDDGNARGDAPTMIMSGLLGALLHPDPRRGLIIGLGTGGTAGWMAAIPSIERVDVVELEPLVLRVARDCAPVNQDVMSNPKVRHSIGDARELLLVSRERYDLVFSEPSNPYRAGVASLFTREYYEAIARRLAPGGLFLQWVQAYEVDARTIRAIYATLQSVFPEVETWNVGLNDLMLVASSTPPEHDALRLRARLLEEPFRSGIGVAWRASDLESVLGWFVARPELARAVAGKSAHLVNTDDQNLVEFGFARSLGSVGLFDINQLRESARVLGADRPLVRGDVNWDRVERARLPFYARDGAAPLLEHGFTPELTTLAAAISLWQSGQRAEGAAVWRRLGREPDTIGELTYLAESLADQGDDAALPYIERLRAFQPLEADALIASLRFRQGRLGEAGGVLTRLLTAFRSDPWPDPGLMREAIDLSAQVAALEPELARPLYEALSRPYAVYAAEDARVSSLAAILGGMSATSPECHDFVRSQEPHYPWNRRWLELRVRCYEASNDPGLDRARFELASFLAREPIRFHVLLGLGPRASGSSP